ncbi:MAG: hypothetical protein AAFZ15_31775, partial [Bacteroidota bacterium]
YNYERLEGYNKGKKVSLSFDKDEDGNIEEILFFNLNGKSTGKSVDIDQDGFFDTLKMVLESQKELIFIDENANGFYEIME